MTRRLPLKRFTIKDIMQRTKSESWLGKNDIEPRMLKFLKTRRKRWYEINKERLVSSQRAKCQQNKEHIWNCRSQYCKNNRERINEYWRSYCAKNKEQIRQRLRDQKQRKIGQNIVRFGAWDQEPEKLETSLVPSDTLCGTPTVKT